MYSATTKIESQIPIAV